MLRASIEYSGREAGLGGISDGPKAGDLGIPHGEKLTAFADAAVAGDHASLASARDALRDAAGSAALVDAAAVIGNFQRMVRIADSTGIPLDGMTDAMSADIRGDLGIEAFRSRRLAKRSPLARLASPLARGAAMLGLRLAGKRAR